VSLNNFLSEWEKNTQLQHAENGIQANICLATYKPQLSQQG